MARYKVTVAPGAPIPNVGFVEAGHTFEQPPSYIPPTFTFEPMDEEALSVMQMTFPTKVFKLGAVAAPAVDKGYQTVKEAVGGTRPSDKAPPRRGG
jgi:hypothetical protein